MHEDVIMHSVSEFLIDALLKFLIGGSPFALVGGLYYASVRKRKLNREADKIGVDAAAVLSNEAIAWIKEAREMASEANLRVESMETRLSNCEQELRTTKAQVRSLERDKVSLLRVVRSFARYLATIQRHADQNGFVYPAPPDEVRDAIDRYQNEGG